MFKRLLILSLLLIARYQNIVAQPPITENQIIIKRNTKQFDLSKLTILEINQHITIDEIDSIFVSIIPDSVYKFKDTLFVKPFSVEENYLMNTNDPNTIRKYYDLSTKTILKIPINQVSKIRAKKQPIALILGTTTTLAYLTSMTSLFAAISNPKITDQGIKTYLISTAVLVTVWPSYFIWGKKRFWFHSKKRNNWTFD